MDDEAVREHVRRVEERLVALERLPEGPRETALDAVQDLVTLYGEGWRRVLAHLESGESGESGAAALADDELIGHLLLVHDLHPAGTEERIRGALEQVRPYLQTRGRDVSLVGLEEGTARIRLEGEGSGPAGDGRSGATVRETVEAAVLGAAPELDRVETVDGGAGSGPLVQLRMGRSGEADGDGDDAPTAGTGEAP